MSKRIIKRTLLAVICVLLALAITVPLFFYIGYELYEYKRWEPDGDSRISDEELLAIASKGELMSDEDYDIIYSQTGLTREGVMRVLESENVKDILLYRNSYFREYELWHEEFTTFCDAVYIDKNARMLPLREGDIIVTSATNFSLWATGHSVLVVDETFDYGLEAFSPGGTSDVCSFSDFKKRPDFLVLRPKVDGETLEEIVEYAKENLVGIAYDPTAGVLSPKYPETLKKTQCAHIVWYAFRKFGIDIDSNGGLVVTPGDIAKSDKLEVLQVFGFDPEKLWD